MAPTKLDESRTVIDAGEVTLAERYHAEGCPMIRTERYGDVRPARPDQGTGPQPVTVTRCIDCGGHTVKEA